MISSLFLCRKLHLFVRKSTKTAATRVALVDSNMHQIVCRLGLRPRPHWGAYSAPPDPLAVFRVGYFYREGRGSGGDGREFVLCTRKKKKSRAHLSVHEVCPADNISIKSCILRAPCAQQSTQQTTLQSVCGKILCILLCAPLKTEKLASGKRVYA